MNLLAIDTSTEHASLALMINDEIKTKRLSEQRQHAHFIMPYIHDLLAKASCPLSALDGIIVGQGPGSFTGIRIACSIAKGLAYGLECPIYPVSSLDAIMHEARTLFNWQDNVLTLIDARMNQLYWAYYGSEGKLSLESVNDANEICLPDEEPFLLAGANYQDYLPQMPVALTQRIMKQQEIYPTALAMLQLVLTGTIDPINPALVLPVYIRNQVVQEVTRG